MYKRQATLEETSTTVWHGLRRQPALVAKPALKSPPHERHLALSHCWLRSIVSQAPQLQVVPILPWMLCVPFPFSTFSNCLKFMLPSCPVPASAQMAQPLSKEAYFTPLRLMASFHWRTLIEEGFLPTIPRWRALIRDLSFWERLVSQTFCRFVRRATSQWLHLSTKQHHRLFWIKIERYDPLSEIPVGPRALPYTVWVSRKARPSPPARRRSHVHPLPALPFSSSSLQAITPFAQKNDG